MLLVILKSGIMDEMLTTEEVKSRFEVVLVAFRNNKMVEEKMNDLQKEFEENNSVINNEISKIQSFFDQLSINAASKRSTLQKTLEDRDEYKFKAESLEKEVLRLKCEISELKRMNQNPTYTEKESEFLHNENIRLLQRERDLLKEANKYEKIEERLCELLNENDRLRKCNTEIQTKLIETEVAHNSTLSKKEEDIKNLNDKLNELKTEIIFMKESPCCTKCNEMQKKVLRIEEVPNITHQEPNTMDQLITVKAGDRLEEENEDKTSHLPLPEDGADFSINKNCLNATRRVENENEESKRRTNRRRKEVNYCELEASSKTSKKREYSKNVGSSNMLTMGRAKAQQKRKRIKKVEQDNKLLDDK